MAVSLAFCILGITACFLPCSWIGKLLMQHTGFTCARSSLRRVGLSLLMPAPTSAWLLLGSVLLLRRMKAAWKAYEERQMPILKQEKPGLKMSQYKDLLWRVSE